MATEGNEKIPMRFKKIPIPTNTISFYYECGTYKISWVAEREKNYMPIRACWGSVFFFTDLEEIRKKIFQMLIRDYIEEKANLKKIIYGRGGCTHSSEPKPHTCLLCKFMTTQ